jgi:hypothetical protein
MQDGLRYDAEATRLKVSKDRNRQRSETRSETYNDRNIND